MKIAVFDTYVQRPDGRQMHFDILVRDQAPDNTLDQVLAHGRRYLAARGLAGAELTAEECRFCHVDVAPEAVEAEVERSGFAILELRHCEPA